MTNRMEWQPIETAPKDGTWIIARDVGSSFQYIDPNYPRIYACRWLPEHVVAALDEWRRDTDDYDPDWYDENDANQQPTHWLFTVPDLLADHPRPTTPVVDHEGGESDPQATRISELEAEVESWAAVANREDECRVMWQTRAESAEAEVERLKGELEKEWEWCADDAAIHSKYPIETEYERGYADGRREAAATIRQRARARSTAMNKGGE
ncbi:hypothetical protein CHELA1G11_13010 [Hyphomicrobiales bacterium]|nr:hypothetical protein CHELA1G2_11300 [Hyphomicrobiales bacterium]CAH1668674.1 hypothetical protein CHELA1G11_13010 [Hyphomicrobiales bacterium]